MRDICGNKLEEKQLLYWRSKGLVVRMERIEEPVIESIRGKQEPPRITISITIPVTGVRPGEEPALEDFVRIVDPAQEVLLAAAMGGKTQ